MMCATALKSKTILIFRTLVVLGLLLLAFPLNMSVVILCSVRNIFRHFLGCRISPQSLDCKSILISGAKMSKALLLARSFHAAGHRVILVETHKYWLSGSRFSNSVSSFYTTPNPKQDLPAYIQALVEIIKKENIDLYIPVCSPAASYYDSLAKPILEGYCDVFHFDEHVTSILDNKFKFSKQAQDFDLTVPKTFEITHPEQILSYDFRHEQRPFILKNLSYDSVHRLNLVKFPCATQQETQTHVEKLPINEASPWIMQEFIEGKEYCTHSTVRNGEIQLHCCSASSAFQLNYEQVENDKIFSWVKQFVKDLRLTGQISFDFIQDEQGKAYAIECNPRTHSAITLFYNHDQLVNAYLDESKLPTLVQPLPESRPTYWLYHELWQLSKVRSLKQLLSWTKRIQKGKEAVLDLNDPLPFLMINHWQIPLLLINNLLHLKQWIRVDFNIGKLVELGGD